MINVRRCPVFLHKDSTYDVQAWWVKFGLTCHLTKWYPSTVNCSALSCESRVSPRQLLQTCHNLGQHECHWTGHGVLSCNVSISLERFVRTDIICYHARGGRLFMAAGQETSDDAIDEPRASRVTVTPRQRRDCTAARTLLSFYSHKGNIRFEWGSDKVRQAMCDGFALRCGSFAAAPRARAARALRQQVSQRLTMMATTVRRLSQRATRTIQKGSG